MLPKVTENEVHPPKKDPRACWDEPAPPFHFLLTLGPFPPTWRRHHGGSRRSPFGFVHTTPAVEPCLHGPGPISLCWHSRSSDSVPRQLSPSSKARPSPWLSWAPTGADWAGPQPSCLQTTPASSKLQLLLHTPCQVAL